jgi:hypothetical protein
MLLVAGCSSTGGGRRFFTEDGGADLSTTSLPDLSMEGNDTPDFATGSKPDLSMPSACGAPSTFGSVGTVTGTAQSGSLMSGDQFVTWQGPLNTSTLPTMLSVQLYANSGAFAGSSTLKTGSFPISGDELNYRTCGVCVLVFTNYNTSDGSFDESYMATGGTVNVTSVSGSFAATVSNVRLQHVTIDGDTFESTPEPDMCKTAVTSASFNDTLQ